MCSEVGFSIHRQKAVGCFNSGHRGSFLRRIFCWLVKCRTVILEHFRRRVYTLPDESLRTKRRFNLSSVARMLHGKLLCGSHVDVAERKTRCSTFFKKYCSASMLEEMK